MVMWAAAASERRPMVKTPTRRSRRRCRRWRRYRSRRPGNLPAWDCGGSYSSFLACGSCSSFLACGRRKRRLPVLVLTYTILSLGCACYSQFPFQEPVPASKRGAAIVSHMVTPSGASQQSLEPTPPSSLSNGGYGGGGVGGGLPSEPIGAKRSTGAAAAACQVTLQLPTLRKPHAVQPTDYGAAGSQLSRQAPPQSRLTDAAAPKLRPIRTSPPPQRPPVTAAVSAVTAERQRRIAAKTAGVCGAAILHHKPSSGRPRAARSASSEGSGSRGRRGDVRDADARSRSSGHSGDSDIARVEREIKRQVCASVAAIFWLR